MSAKYYLWILMLLLTASAAEAFAKAPAAFVPRQVEGAELRLIGKVPVAILSGSPEEIGRQHGQLLAGPGEAMVEFPMRFAERFGVEMFWPLVTQAGKTLMTQAPERHQRELAAIAAHSDLKSDQLAVGNTLLELRRLACSTIVVEPARSATGGPIFGRNFDFLTLGDLDKYSMVIVYRPEGKRPFAAVTFPGMVGVFSGMNDAGLAVATLDVEHAGDKSRKFNPTGTPLAFVFRRILEECRTVDEAEALLRSIKATTWMNLTVCDRDGGATFEITPDNIARRDDDEGLIRCTNHFVSEGLSVGETCWRYNGLEVPTTAGPVGVRDVQRLLDSVNQGDQTLQTMVFEPRELMLHLAIGEPPVSGNRMERIELRPLFTP